jgi:hypothetical protein
MLLVNVFNHIAEDKQYTVSQAKLAGSLIEPQTF